mmetsp:Transcript_28379/g.72919  ORF Transcript_28379/g.72919 Transcript_28379/m.72919 type:complete len:184 (+) Transcript_28379:1431-1982(+)
MASSGFSRACPWFASRPASAVLLGPRSPLPGARRSACLGADSTTRARKPPTLRRNCHTPPAAVLTGAVAQSVVGMECELNVRIRVWLLWWSLATLAWLLRQASSDGPVTGLKRQEDTASFSEDSSSVVRGGAQRDRKHGIGVALADDPCRVLARHSRQAQAHDDLLREGGRVAGAAPPLCKNA